MGKEIPRSFEKIRFGEQLNLKGRGFTNLASLTAAGLTPATGLSPANGAAASGGQAAGSAGGLSGAARTEYLVGGAVLVSASAYAAPAFDG